MSFSGISYQKMPPEIGIQRTSSCISICKAFATFKKWRRIFSNENHFFILNEDSDGAFIYFVNKYAFINIINNNIDIFLKEIGEDFTIDSFLKEIGSERRHFLEIIRHHEGILGILLGYGRHNSMLFQRKADILGRCWAYEQKTYMNPSDCNAIHKELRDLNDKLGSFSKESDYCSLLPVYPLGFAADLDHPETKQLTEKYQILRKKINTIYNQGQPTRIIMDMLSNSK